MGLFSRLSAEIRNQIYEYVLTHMNIHIDCRFLDNAVVHPSERMNVYMVNGQPWGISAMICSAETTDLEAYAKTKLSKRDESAVQHYEDRHAPCLRLNRAVSRQKIPLALLKTCRQINHEATGYLYSDNTFSFKSPEDCDLFLSIALTPLLRSFIRSLRVHCETTRYPGSFSALTKDTSAIYSLENLRCFGLTVAHYHKAPGIPGLPKIPTEKLEKVEVIIGPMPFPRGLMTEAWKNRYHAEEFERRLMGREMVGERYDRTRACLVSER